ncbi:MAG: exodeoxyribonuclease V subunit gamma, partial [Oscillospiraceae bacterium]|nr:exodeoxyribonuclease V subunit gamma [Oscillospiraceae bacterium]
MLQFITGESGSGKSIYIINKIAEDLRDGKRVILLVPEQHAVEAERKIEEIAVDVPTINLEVLNFKRLCNRVFREYGGLSYSYVGKGAQNLIMWRTLSTYLPFLKEYKDVAPTDKNFIKLMMQTIKELKNFSITPNILEQTADILIEDNRNLTNKLYDISLIYAKYDSILTGEYNAQTDELKLLSEISSENEFFKGYNIYIDSFSGFTMLEYEILRNMFKQADNIFVTMAVTSDSTNPIYAGIHYTLAQLKKIASNNHVEISEDIILTDKRRFNNGELKFLADNLNFSYTEDIYPTEPSNIAVYECNSIYAEAEAAAKDILKKVRHGARYNEVTVIMRDVSRYYGIIDAIFEKYEIPYFMSVRVDIATKPLIRLVISVLAIINNFWRVGDVISYIKTGLCGITYD